MHVGDRRVDHVAPAIIVRVIAAVGIVAGKCRGCRGGKSPIGGGTMPSLSTADHRASPPRIHIPRDYNAAHDLIERNLAAGRAAKTAYIDDAGAYTYGDLAERVNRCANALIGPRPAARRARAPVPSRHDRFSRRLPGRHQGGHRADRRRTRCSRPPTTTTCCATAALARSSCRRRSCRRSRRSSRSIRTCRESSSPARPASERESHRTFRSPR